MTMQHTNIKKPFQRQKKKKDKAERRKKERERKHQNSARQQQLANNSILARPDKITQDTTRPRQDKTKTVTASKKSRTEDVVSDKVTL